MVEYLLLVWFSGIAAWQVHSDAQYKTLHLGTVILGSVAVMQLGVVLFGPPSGLLFNAMYGGWIVLAVIGYLYGGKSVSLRVLQFDDIKVGLDDVETSDEDPLVDELGICREDIKAALVGLLPEGQSDFAPEVYDNVAALVRKALYD